MQDYRDGFMSVLFIECAALHQEFPSWAAYTPCCENCHSEEHKATYKIYVRPIGPDGLNADWYLCVEAIVCCALYHRVRELPYEWWVAKSVKYGVKREDMRGYIYPASPEKNTEREKTPNVGPTKARSYSRDRKSDRERDEEAGFSAWKK